MQKGAPDLPPRRGQGAKPIGRASRYAFTRGQRLLAGEQYRRVFARGKRSADRLFAVIGLPNQHDRPRLGLAISKKAARDAVARNRLKRVAREAFRQLDTLQPFDLVVTARPGAARATNSELHSSLTGHFLKLAGPDKG